MRYIPSALLTVLFTLTFLSRANASDRCGHCGCQANCEKVCRLVVEDKKVQITCWGCECEDFCVPGPSCRGCRNSEEVCSFYVDKGEEKICSQPKKFVWYDWIPNPCAEVQTRKKLMKRTVTKTVPGYRWVVEDLCASCESKAVGAPIIDGSDVPPPPLVNVKLKYSRPTLTAPAPR